jgi:hypothetical protein
LTTARAKTCSPYYPDEILFDEGELVGLTEADARDLRQKKDIAYLRSP